MFCYIPPSAKHLVLKIQEQMYSLWMISIYSIFQITNTYWSSLYILSLVKSTPAHNIYIIGHMISSMKFSFTIIKYEICVL